MDDERFVRKCQCPYCGGWKSRVKDPRESRRGYRRVRICGGCGAHYSTTESVDAYQHPKLKHRPQIKPTDNNI